MTKSNYADEKHKLVVMFKVSQRINKYMFLGIASELGRIESKIWQEEITDTDCRNEIDLIANDLREIAYFTEETI